MDIHECIRTRRSIRVYKDEPVPEEKLRRVLEAIQWAPSWVNLQPWEVLVIRDRDLMAQIAACIPDANPGKKALGMAPVLLAICGWPGKSGYYGGRASTEHGDWVMFDLGIACQNACLAAWELGLGTLHLALFDHAAAARVIGLPEGLKLFELIPLGVPLKPGRVTPRRTLEEFVHYERFTSRPPEAR
jgi:nitroreductase